MSRREDELLAEYWRTTARAPRAYPGAKTYSLGLDVLGALPAKKVVTVPPPKAPPKASTPPPKKAVSIPPPATPGKTATSSTAPKAPTATPRPAAPAPALSRAVLAKANAALNKAQAAASHAMSTAGKLARYHPKMANSLKALSSTTSKATAQLTTLRDNPPGGKPGVPSGASLMGDGVVYGPSPGDPVVDASATTTDATAGTTELAAQAGDIAVQILPVIDQLKQKGDATSISLAQEGQSIVDLCNRIVQEGADEAANMQGAGSMGDTIKQKHRAM